MSPGSGSAGPVSTATRFHQVGGQDVTEYWIPAEDLSELNDKIVGLIELAAEYQ